MHKRSNLKEKWERMSLNMIEEVMYADENKIPKDRWLQRSYNFVRRFSGEPSTKAKDFVKNWHKKHGKA